MVNETVKLIVEKLKEIYLKDGGRSIFFVEMEKKFYSAADLDDLCYFFENCRDEEGALFHEQECINCFLNKTNVFNEEMFKAANTNQKKLMLLKSIKSNDGAYLTNMFILCPNKFKKEKLLLAKYVIKKGNIEKALRYGNCNDAVKDYLLKAACKKSSVNMLISILVFAKQCNINKINFLTKSQQEFLVNSICKRDNVACFTDYLFTKRILSKQEICKFVAAIGKKADCYQIENTIKYHAGYLTYDQVDYLKGVHQKHCRTK